MDSAAVFEKIRDIIAEQLGIEKETIKLETSFKDGLKADSLDLFQVISDIEDAYDVTIENAETIATVSDAVNYVTNKAGK